MRNQWTLAAVLSSALIVGCSDRTTETTQNPAENAGSPGENGSTTELAPAEREASPQRDGSSVGDNRPAASANRTPATTRPAAPASATPVGTPSSRATAAPSTPPAPPAARVRELTVPAGTSLPLELLTALSSESAQIETPVRARLRQAVSVDGYTVLPAGAVLHGNVTDVDRAGRVRGRSRLVFRFTEVEASGGREDLRTNPLAFEGEATLGEDATKVGAGAVGGAIIGGILGGGDGAAKGAAIGGAAGSGVVLATRGKEVALAAGTSLAASVAEPMTITVSAR